MSNIQQAIQVAAGRFANEIVSILRAATLSDIVALTGKSVGIDGVETAPRRRGRPPGSRTAERNGQAGDKRADKTTKGQKRRGKRAGKKRSREEVTELAGRVVEFLKGSKQEVGVSAIAEALKVSTADLGLPLTRLREEGAVKVHGQKRSTVYRIA